MPDMRFMTPEEVLHALRLFGQMDSDQPFSVGGMEQIRMEAPIQELQLVSGGNLSSELAGFFFSPGVKWFNIGQVRDELAERTAELETVMANVSTVDELCRELACRVQLTPLDEFQLLDRPCSAGSIFLTLKRRLAENGMKVHNLAPSSRLPFRGLSYPNYCMVIREAALIAPNRVPLSESAPSFWLYGCAKIIGCLSILLVCLLGILDIQVAGAIGIIGTLTIVLTTAGWILAFLHRSNALPGVQTYRDLCKILAGEPIAGQHLQNQGANAPRSPMRVP
ncbi:MAG TPA: hypothetical protein VN641_11530 [Urbifossiella sp.]|nr:hypothetical protein [Urbifossiella sp.]